MKRRLKREERKKGRRKNYILSRKKQNTYLM